MEKELEANFRFGLVAAMSKKDRVIGVNGKLPWNLPTDRKVFMDLTRNKTLIIGRHTFLERPNQTHLAHLQTAIVVSKTFADNPPEITTTTTTSPCIIWVDSLQKALWEAYQISLKKNNKDNSECQISSPEPSIEEELDDIDCWIGGGERLYRDALLHPSAQFLHLTEVDMENLSFGRDDSVAYFPAKYRWDHVFKPVNNQQPQEETIILHENDDNHPYTIQLYRNRLTQQRCFTC